MTLVLLALGASASRSLCADEAAEDVPPVIRAADHLGAERHVLVIGIDDYADPAVPDLRHRERGARDVRVALTDPEVGGVAEPHAQVLLGRAAGLEAIRTALQSLSELPREATVLVYFAGHLATADGTSYWVAHDSRARNLASTALSAAEVLGLLAHAPPERILLVVDGCLHARLGGKGLRASARGATLQPFLGERHAGFVSAVPEAHAREDGGHERPLFTHHLLRGLRGRADADEDGVVTLAEACDFVDRQMHAEAVRARDVERPALDPRGRADPTRVFLAVEPEGMMERLLDEEQAWAARRKHATALGLLHRAGAISAEDVRLGLHLVGVLPEGLESYEIEQRDLFLDVIETRLDAAHLPAALAALRRPDRRTLIVPDEIETIQAAIDAAAAGDTVLVRAGEYREHVAMKTGVRLLGEGRQRTVIQYVPGKPEALLVKDCAWGVVESLQFDGSGGVEMDGWRPDCAHILRSAVRLRDFLCHSSLGCGVYATGEGTRVNVQSCVFEHNGQDGISLHGVEGGTIDDCVCRSNGAVGVDIRSARGPVLVRRCECVENPQSGIGIHGGATATFEANVCRSNGGHGIVIWEAGTTVTLERNTCDRNALLGVFVVQGASATATGDVYRRNGESGFTVSGVSTKATLVDCLCEGNAEGKTGALAGVAVHEGAAAAVRQSTFEENVTGILVTGKGSSARLEGNTCRGNTEHGIVFADAAGGEAVTNRCEENGQAGIHVTGWRTRVEIRENICALNGTDGIRFSDRAGGTAVENKCRANGGYGISAYDLGTRPTIRNNRGSDNGRPGVGSEERASPIDAGNDLGGPDGG